MLEFTTAFQQAVLTDTSQLASCCWEIKHTHVNCPHEREELTEMVCKFSWAGWQTWKTRIVLLLEHTAKHPFPSAREHLAWSLPSGFISETRRREKEQRFESTSSNLQQGEGNSLCNSASLSEGPALLCCLHMKASEHRAWSQLLGNTTCCTWGTQTGPTFHNCKILHPQTTALDTTGITQSNWDVAKDQYLQKPLLQLRHQSHCQVFKAWNTKLPSWTWTILRTWSNLSAITTLKLDYFEIIAQSVISQVLRVCS